LLLLWMSLISDLLIVLPSICGIRTTSTASWRCWRPSPRAASID
jgi:hypothetical protein